MNWLDRARREMRGTAGQGTANTAERNPTAVTAVSHPDPGRQRVSSIGSNGSAPSVESQALRDAFEERAAIMEFDGGLSREEAERAAWAHVRKFHRLH